MTLIIVLLVVMAVYYAVMGWINKYSWVVSLIMVSLAASMYSVMMMVAIRGNYVPVGLIGYLDEMYFLSIVKNRMNMFSINRIFNVSVALYIFSLVNFVPVFFNHFGRYDIKRFLKRLPAAVFPLVYIWFYDKQTSYTFYNRILFGDIAFEFIKVLDLLVTIVFFGYLLWPLVYIVMSRRNIKLKHKRKQVLGVFMFVLFLDIIMLIIYRIAYTRHIYMYDTVNSLISVSGTFYFGGQRYFITLVSIIAMIVLSMFTAIKFEIMPRRGMLVRHHFAKDMQRINNNFFSMFHSVKKTIFMYKILAERALEEDGEKSKEILRELIGEIDTYMERVSHMQQINNEPEIFMEHLPVSEIIDDAVSRYSHDKSVDIVCNYESDDIMVEADSFYLADVFDNILKNAVEAIKRKKDTGRVEVSAECEHEWVILRFADDGEGISKKDIKNVFKPLYTTKARTTNWGLGLSFAMKIIKIHMGHILAESVHGEGTTITILLPRVK